MRKIGNDDYKVLVLIAALKKNLEERTIFIESLVLSNRHAGRNLILLKCENLLDTFH